MNSDTEDRRFVSVWFCDWFARRLGSTQTPASGAECELAVNSVYPVQSPVFETTKAHAGGMWAKARRGERPFSIERMADVVIAADRLGFWSQKWRHELSRATGERDHLTLLILSLLAVDGFANQKEESTRFNRLKRRLKVTLQALASAVRSEFVKARSTAVSALEDWEVFASELQGGFVDLDPALIDSMQGPKHDDPRRWILHPARTIKRIKVVRFGKPESVELARRQVWAMAYRAHQFSDAALLKIKILKTSDKS